MKKTPETKWDTIKLSLLAGMFDQIKTQSFDSMSEDMATLASEAVTDAPDALNWAAKEIENLRRRLNNRPRA